MVTLSRALPEPCATLVLFLTLTGLRIGEACGLRWKHVNLTGRAVLVNAEMLPPLSIGVREAFVMNRYQTLKPSAAGKRTIPLPEWLADRMRTLPRYRTTDAVFANLGGTAPLDQHNVARRVLKPTAEALGNAFMDGSKAWVSWHSFRHTWATLSDQLGLSQTERMRLLGHSNASVTAGYTHPELEQMRTKLAKLPKVN